MKAGCGGFLGVLIPVYWRAYGPGNFLWLSDLSEPDPYKILPILAGLFQFVQTKMMRPSGQGKITDPQQAMMNTMMNFMPLMVIFFGWSFISGAVLYWAIQSVYSVVQQWLIGGWGAIGEKLSSVAGRLIRSGWFRRSTPTTRAKFGGR